MSARLFRHYSHCWAGWCWLLLFNLLAPVAFAQQGWLPGFNISGLNRKVIAVSVHGRGDVVAAGNFTDAGGNLAADGAARWNGHTWQALGRGPGIGPDSDVRAALCLPGGEVVLAVYVPSDSTLFGSSFVTRWDGRHWQQLGPSFTTDVEALVVDAHGDLLAGMRGLAACTSGVLRWNGQHWQPLGLNNPANTGGSSISQLLVQPDGSLVATGYLDTATGQRIMGTARWTGTTWQRLGADVREPGSQAHLALEATGKLINLNDYSANANPPRPTFWDGTTWQPLATGLAGRVERIFLAPLTQELRATSRFSLPGDTVTQRVVRWDGIRWQLAGPLPGALASLPSGTALAQLSGGDVLADCGPGLAWWNGSTWQQLTGAGQAGLKETYSTSVQALAVTPKGAVLLAGNFQQDFSKADDNVARWHGRRQPVGPGFSNSVGALAVTRAGDFVAGGTFEQTGAHDSARFVAYWHGRHWRQLGAGLPSQVNVLAVAPNGGLLAGGSFGVARWNGRSWEFLTKTEPETNAPTNVHALAIAPTGEIFSSSSYRDDYHERVVSVISRWNGAGWQRVGKTLFFDVASLVCTSTGDLIAGGGIRHSHEGHSSTTGYVRRWNGTSWQAIGPELDGEVNAMALAANGDLLIGGTFEDAGKVYGEGGHPAADNVARWHDGAWQPLGAGLNRGVDALVVAPNGDIVVGGTFTATNDGLAMWHFGIFRDR